MTRGLNRRRFLQGSAASLGYFLTAPAVSAQRAAKAPNGTVHIAGIGVGGKGSSDIDHAGGLGEVVALCDIDEGRLNGKASKFPSAKKYFDYRKLFDEMGKQIDAVTVSTPDHTHALPSIIAMTLKKGVYTQKPLTHSVYEARLMRDTAKKYGVATQLGNQGSAENGLRRAVEIIQAGTLGKITEVHVWTNRPVWPQAPGITKRPDREDPVPPGIHWDEWIGPAPFRPYVGNRTYHDFNWRGWWDFGTGALGDMACHTANMAFRACKLGHPKSIQGECGDLNPETYPSWARVTFVFPARDEAIFPEAKFIWYEGRKDGKLVLPPEELLAKLPNGGKNLAPSGSIIVGDKGILFSPNDYGAKFVLLPEEQHKDVKKDKPERLPATTGDIDKFMKKEWIDAIKGGPAPYSNFDYAALLTETILLGNIAIRMTGQKLDWDGPNLKFTNNPKANEHVRREYRKGWELPGTA